MSKDLIRGFLLAHNAPDEILRALEELRIGEGLTSPCMVSEVLLDDLPLSVRTAGALKNADIRTLGELLQISERELLYLPNFGRKSLNELKELIKPAKLAPSNPLPLLNHTSNWKFPREAA